jgi:hypothetical protein
MTARRSTASLVRDEEATPCPLRARYESQERYPAGTHGQPEMAIDLQCAARRRHDNPFPKLTVVQQGPQRASTAESGRSVVG